MIIAGFPGVGLTLSGGLGLIGALSTISTSSQAGSGDFTRLTTGFAFFLLVVGLVILAAALLAAAGNRLGRISSIVIMLLGAVFAFFRRPDLAGMLFALPPIFGAACLGFGSPELV